MGRRIFIIAGLFVAVVILGIMAFVQPRDKKQEQAAAMQESLAGNAAPPLSATLPPVAQTPAPVITLAPTIALPTLTPGTPEPILITTPAPTPTPEVTPTPAPTAAVTPKVEASATPYTPPKVAGKPLSGYIIGVDPGHQKKDNKAQEPVAPGSAETKKKVSSGTYGRFSGTPEHEVNLNVGLHLQAMLQEAGATVVMVRETADVDISNVERALLFNEKKVDLGVRLHCNGSNDPSVAGAFMLVPKTNPFKAECDKAAKLILESYGEATGIGIKKGITVRSDQTGFNWCERAIVNIEMGHMTNEEEDYKLSNKEFQKKMAVGVFEGILRYFEQRG